MPRLVRFCPLSLSLVYITRKEATLLTARRQLLHHQATSEQQTLEGAFVVALLPGQGLRARQVIKISDDDGSGDTLQLCDGSKTQLQQLSEQELGAFSPQQLRSLCCELSLRMLRGLSPRMQADQARNLYCHALCAELRCTRLYILKFACA